MKRLLTILSVMTLWPTAMLAQRTTDLLDRGLVAVPSGSGSFVSWRIFGEEYYDTKYNLYRDGVKLNAEPLDISNYVDNAGRAGSKYQVAAVVRGVEQEKSAEVTRLGQQYIQFAVKDLYSRRGTKITSDYQINDIALADVTGDGISEFIMKRNYVDKLSIANDSAFNCIEVYTLQGDRLWWIDLGPNMVSGPDEQYDAVGYDWDGDGRAEVLLRGADNMIIHCSDGSTVEVGNMKVNTRNTVNQSDGNLAYTNTGAEYLLYLEGSTGKPYSIGPDGQLWAAYPLPRGNANDWGDGYGHRSTKHYFAAPFLDGRHPFIFLGRGCYTKHHMKAFSVDPLTHQLSLYWEWKSSENNWSDPWFGNGYHNFGIADVDWDGRDEICFGSMVIDDNGKGLSTTGLGHGDAQHCSDFDPYRHGQEIFACNEEEPAMNYRNATTSKIYYRLQTTSDDGRALCGNFSNDYPGAIGHSSQSGTISCVADKVIANGPSGFTNNWRIYWDGDLLEEGLDGAGTEGVCRVYKANGQQVFSTEGTKNCNWTKNTPSAAGDIIGDWREEIIVRTSDNKYVRVYTTNIKTNYRNYTLWHDHQYRQGMVWETVGYNQPPHASYFIGELEGITVAPPPLTMTGRTEVLNGGTIGSTLNDHHVIVCETADTKVTVEDGARPWVMTFNVPSWVQGTNSNLTNGNPKIDYDYYTCTVEGGAFAGETRLVKQGDGTLQLPDVVQKYTGPTDVWAGTLSFDGTLEHSPLWLNRFAELNSDGGHFMGGITMDYDAKLRPGGADKQGTITTTTLAMGFGSRIIFDLYNDGLSADKVVARQLTITTRNWQYGPQYQVPVFQFVTHLADGDEVAPGRYLIGEIDEPVSGLDKVHLEGIDTKLKAVLVQEGKNLYIEISGMRDAADITWTGSLSNIWNVADTENFISDGQSNFFVTGDNVRFDDSASQFSVSLNGELEADTVFVDNTKTYTFGGTGALVGNTTLVKQGTGTLVIRNDNTYTGGNRLSGGIVTVSSLANANQPKGNLGAMTTAGSKFVMENGAELRTSAVVTNGSAIRFEGEEGGVINNSADFIVDRAMLGTTMTKKGTGWLKLNVANTSLQRMIVAAGTVQCINSNRPAATVEYQGGTLRENTGTSYTIHVPQGKTGTWYMANRSTYSNKVTGGGILNAYCITEKGTNYYATRTPVQCDFSAFEGTLRPSSSLDDPALLRFTLATSKGMPLGTMNIVAGVEVQNSGKTFRIGKVTGAGNLGGSCTFSNGTSVGANTWQVGNDDDWTTSVKVTSNANFTKVGRGRITWTAASTNSGVTTINEGELSLSTNGKLGTGRLTVGPNGILSGTNKKSSPLANSAIIVNGILAPDNLYIDSKNVTINEGGTLLIAATRCATSTNAGCSTMEGIATLTLNGTLRIQPGTSASLQVGDSIRIFTAEKVVGTPEIADECGIEWDATRISEGLLFVKSIDTAIAPVVSASAPRNIYDTRGHLVRAQATTTEGLPAGIYICEGRKFVVR